MLCILYVNIVGLLVSIIGVLVERLLPMTSARRWIWCGALLVSVVLPGFYRDHHALRMGTASTLDVPLLGRMNEIDAGIAVAWALTSTLLICWTVVNAGWISHLVRVARTRTRGLAPSVVGDVPVVFTDSIGPATVGVLRSRILLPRWVLAMPDAQRQYIVRHEDEHRRSHDATLLFVASLSVILLPWSAALWWQLRRLHLAVEMDCDRRVISTLGNPHAYGTVLLSVAEAGMRGPRLQPALLGRPGMLERRLTALLSPVLLPRPQKVLLAAAALILFGFVVTTPHPVLATHVHSPANAPSSAAVPR